jgi:ligand-binding SRPBCC domain-containing protein
MPLIELETQIAAPIDRVFDLARSIDAHMASTEGSNERAVAGRTSGLIEESETVTWEARHFGIKQRLSVRVTKFDRPTVFGDEMVSGAFASMHHTHRFTPSSEGTVMKDEFHFTAPFGFLGRIAEELFLTSYMRRFLAKRAAELKAMAESEEWRRYLTPKEEQSGTGQPATRPELKSEGGDKPQPEAEGRSR